MLWSICFKARGGGSPSEAQLLGRLVMLKALSRLGNDNKTGAIDALHRWAFGSSADEEALNYWLQVYNRSGAVDDVISQMSSAAQDKTSHLRVRSLAGLTSVLTENFVKENNNSNSTEPHELPAMSRSQVEYIAQSEKNPEDFIRSLYANIFKRIPDPDGLAYWVNIAGNRDNWTLVVGSFYDIVDDAGSENDRLHHPAEKNS